MKTQGHVPLRDLTGNRLPPKAKRDHPKECDPYSDTIIFLVRNSALILTGDTSVCGYGSLSLCMVSRPAGPDRKHLP